ncbi:Diphthamide biosynthesis protein 4 [Metschnikowia bicuspidata var. bicuspidata NRRL YB-4993]|uniref:Diphthamide biosynthesis protein 4 n=1 Tax=Metschnikowia bicuspidata var. bicuspidata NRRL YB-4993 TaxID=869754 RepID=A0A1A0HAI8_9ASCO|nr:Diphthamide biosynthesis protein 4 [Metschnikowia bicuspidata var. bicuspidata NRRL YB-4993]OBA21026.1 Diphthamide biosynthesis protein 4 [Metschnikowia bicuspidata var. bicuspidata NRRL YB-4993]
MEKTHYEVLGVPSDASAKCIRTAYHQLLLRAHPDKSRGIPAPLLAADAGSTIAELQAAYAVLADDLQRHAYDDELKTAFKKQGFNITGAGLDFHTLAEFTETHVPNTDEYQWTRDCPRCTSLGSILLTESDLERGTADGTGGYQIVAPCLACSLWITVLYEEATEE